MEKISEIALFQQSETYALVVETRTTVKEIAMTIGRSFMEIETLFKEQNAVMADVPFVEYLNFESMSEDIHMIIGFKSAKILCGKGNIRAITIPGRKIVSCLHKGNYTELASLYREMQEWIAAKGYKPSGASIEYYYSKPGTSEEELATKVEMPLRQKIMGAVLQAQTGLVTKEHLELAVTKPNSPVNFALRNDTEDKERILRALKQANGNRKVAAELLGIGRTTLYSKLEEYGLKYKFQQP